MLESRWNDQRNKNKDRYKIRWNQNANFHIILEVSVKMRLTRSKTHDLKLHADTLFKKVSSREPVVVVVHTVLVVMAGSCISLCLPAALLPCAISFSRTKHEWMNSKANRSDASILVSGLLSRFSALRGKLAVCCQKSLITNFREKVLAWHYHILQRTNNTRHSTGMLRTQKSKESSDTISQ